MKHILLGLAAWALLSGAACSQAQSTPEALAKAVQSAFGKGDFEAARRLAEMDMAPADLHFFYFDAVWECAGESVCTARLAAADNDLIDRLKEQASQINAEVPTVEGTVVIEMKARDGSSSGKMSMPYAKTGGAYKLVSIAYTAQEIAKLKATTNESLVKEFFTRGIRGSAMSEPRTDWETAATKLPADGGDVGKAYLKQTRAMAAAVDAKDPDAAMNSGSQMAKIIYRDKNFDGTLIPLAERKAKLKVQALRMVRDVTIKGGYQMGDSAVLVIEARAGVGRVTRGPILLVDDGGVRDEAGAHFIRYPASP